MSIKNFLAKQDFLVDKKEFEELEKEINTFIEILKKSISKRKIDADVFLGGSFAKGTLVKSEKYDADVFVRFDSRYENLSDELEEILKETRLPIEKLHGSRDYFRIKKNDKLTIEVIPVLRIKKVREARNVTDLSYFHVNYVKRNLKKDMKNELALSKKFFKAHGVYGAESYIKGFSGYGLECLIIYYKSFEKMLGDLVKTENEKKIIDLEGDYKKKEDVFFALNESKTQGPIILIDPTWKERNVLASLSWETFRKFQEVAGKFLKKPSEKYFERKNPDFEKMKNKKGEFIHIVLETDRQEGDIAGTKLKKFSDFLSREMSKYFEVLEKEFCYEEGQKAVLYLVVKSKKEIVRIGPPLKMEKEVKKFRAKNKKTFVRKGILYAKIKIDFDGREFLEKFDRKKMKEMGVKIIYLSLFSNAG